MHKIEVKFTDEDGNIHHYFFSDDLLTDEEIEEYAKGVYGQDDEIWKRITNGFILGAKWGRDVLRARQQQLPLMQNVLNKNHNQ